MAIALELAAKAALLNEVPIGALVVSPSGDIIGKGYNQTEMQQCQNAHAEQLAIKEATVAINNWRLDNHLLYITLEPCSMCMGLASLSRIAGIMYGASSPVYGYQLDKNNDFHIHKKNAPFVIGGVLEKQSIDLLQSFFKKKRYSS